MFIGREREMVLLRDFWKRRPAGLVVCRGRRRIGKSTLIEKCGEGKLFYEFYGLSPREGITNESQLKHFGEMMGMAFKLPVMHFENWHEALSTQLSPRDRAHRPEVASSSSGSDSIHSRAGCTMTLFCPGAKRQNSYHPQTTLRGFRPVSTQQSH